MGRTTTAVTVNIIYMICLSTSDKVSLVWTNFEIGDLEFWRSEAYSTFFDFLDKKGGFYYEVLTFSSNVLSRDLSFASDGETLLYIALQWRCLREEIR